ncbi:GHKL domain-containing protein [Lachnospiraceae bacterium 62-35]
MSYVIFDFLLYITQKKGRKYIPLWLAVNGFVTWIVTCYQLQGTFLFSILFLIFFAKVILGIQGLKMITPVTIIFTLYTLTEGFSVFAMSWISVNLKSPAVGRWLQILVPFLLNMLFFCALWLIQRRYFHTLQKPISSYLYILLLPCTLIVLGIRYGLKLDRSDFEPYLSSFGVNTRLLILFIMLGAAVIVFITIEVFCKIIDLTGQEKALVLLESQLDSQRIYIEEAKKRNEQYSAFQHDIDNHLLVLSGLLHEGLLEQAKLYTEKLHISSKSLFSPVSTGNAVLDVLLREKFSYARQNQIEVIFDIHIPRNFHMEDMDLCVLFSNILDNGITACTKETCENRFLTLSGRVRSKFLIVEAVNTASEQHKIRTGTGLTNIQQIAEKYQGTVEMELSNGRFRISVLICSS